MNIENIRIGMPLFAARLDQTQCTITVYSGVAVSMVLDTAVPHGGKVTVARVSDDGKAKEEMVFEAVETEPTAVDAIDVLYLRLMLALRMFSAATRKAEWLCRFAKINKGKMRFNVAVPIEGKEKEDAAEMDSLIKQMVEAKAYKDGDTLVVSTAGARPDATVPLRQVASKRGKERFPESNGIDHNELPCQCKDDCPEICNGKDCNCPSCGAAYSDRVCER